MWTDKQINIQTTVTLSAHARQRVRITLFKHFCDSVILTSPSHLNVLSCCILAYYSFAPPPLIGQCPPLINPSSGTVVVNSTRVGGVAFYSCLNGYTRIGLSTRVCLTRETWSGDEPECISSE